MRFQVIVAVNVTMCNSINRSVYRPLGWAYCLHLQVSRNFGTYRRTAWRHIQRDRYLNSFSAFACKGNWESNLTGCWCYETGNDKYLWECLTFFFFIPRNWVPCSQRYRCCEPTVMASPLRRSNRQVQTSRKISSYKNVVQIPMMFNLKMAYWNPDIKLISF